MRALAALVVALVLPVAAFALRGADTAYACTGPGALQGMLETPIVVEGRVAAAERLPQDDRRPAHSPYELTMEVTRVHRGASDPLARFVVYLPDPGVPQACPSFEFQGDPVGDYMVIGLREESAGRWVGDRGTASFVGDGPTGDDYARGVHLAEMIGDSDPAAPRVTLAPSAPACGEEFRVRGERFQPGRYLLHAMFEGRILATPTAGPDGTFDVTARLVSPSCGVQALNGRVLGLHVNAFPTGADLDRAPFDFETLTEIIPLTISGAVDRDPPGPHITAVPQAARCGEDVTVTGAGFLPGEALLVGVGESSVTREVSADGRGAFTVVLRLPADDCAGVRYPTGAGYASVWVSQVGAGLTPDWRTSLAGAELYFDAPPPSGTPAAPSATPAAASPTPGAPDAGLGTRPPAPDAGLPVGFVLLAGVFAAAGCAAAAWSWWPR